jgi:photosystem II stability/assembly factor-like uncharacterized protein
MRARKTFRWRLALGSAIPFLFAATVSPAQEWVSADLSGELIAAIAVDPSSSSRVYASLFGTPANFLRAAVARTSDRGSTWFGSDEGFGSAAIRALLTQPGTPSTLWAGSNSGLFRSTDGGVTWSLHAVRAVRALAIDPQTPSTMYLGSPSEGVQKSVDGGVTWASASNGIGNQRVNALAVHPTDTRILYAGAAGAVYRSNDAAASWTQVLDATGLSIVFQPTNPAVAYVGSFDGVRITRDSGATWTTVAVPPLGGSIDALAIHPFAPTVVYAATSSSGVWRSADSGATWVSFSTGLPEVTILALAASAGDPATLWAGTENGIYRHDLAPGSCAGSATELCLQGGRFRVSIAWVDERNRFQGVGVARPLESDTGAFWFFSSNNLELMVKVLDGRAFNGRFWVFYGALSDVRYEITVRDTLRGVTKTYSNATGNLASVADTAAFEP